MTKPTEKEIAEMAEVGLSWTAHGWHDDSHNGDEQTAVGSTSVVDHSPPASELRVVTESDRWPDLGAVGLYGLVGDVVATLEPFTEADPVALLVDFLLSFGNAVGAGPHALADGSVHSARLNAVLVGETAKARKGTARRQVSRLFERVDETWAKERVMGGLASGEGLIAAVAEREDATPDPRMMVVEEEFSRVLAVASRDGSTLSQIIRQAWDHGNLRVMTRKEPLKASSAHISVLAHTTTEELRRRLSETEVSNGFANRFLFVSVRRSKRLPNGGDPDESDISRLVLLLRTRLMEARRAGRLRRSPEADARWAELYEIMADDESAGLLGSVTARAEAQVLRLSVAYALTDGSSTIEIAHLEAAWALWCYCQASAARIFGDASGDEVADRLLEAITAAGSDGLDLTAQSAVFGRHVQATRLASARGVLERLGRIVSEPEQTDGRSRLVSYAKQAKQANEGAVSSPSSLISLPSRAERWTRELDTPTLSSSSSSVLPAETVTLGSEVDTPQGCPDCGGMFGHMVTCPRSRL